MATITKSLAELLEKNTEDIKEELLAILTAQSYIEGDFILASGKKSTYYIDGKQTTLDARGILLISSLFYELLNPDITAVGGMSVGADPLATGLSLFSTFNGNGLDTFYVRKEPKKHGTSKWIEGPLKKDAKVAILEDVVTTGGSSLKAIEKVKEFGCDVSQVLSIVDRKSGGEKAFANLGIEYTYLFDINEVIAKSKIL